MGKELIKFIDKNAKVVSPTERISYSQDWPAYNKAKTNEKGQFIQILSELNSLLEVEYRKRRGHPNSDLQDMIFACVIKVHSQLSSRRAVSELKLLKEKGYIEQVPHFNTLLNYFNEKDMTPVLRKLIWLSSLPLKKVESDFAADSSGFSTSLFSRWFDNKWGKEKDKRVWRKAHVISGIKTNIITSVEVIDGNVGDSTQFPALVEAIKKNFSIKEVSADKAYSSRRNLKIVADAGGLPFIPFKKNVTGRPFGNKIWRAMYDYSILYADEFMQHYHKRSNAETVFHMLKSKFGNNLKSKTFTGQINEILLKCLCHNICVLIQEMHEIGLEVNYCADRSLAQQIVI
jgi:transposase